MSKIYAGGGDEADLDAETRIIRAVRRAISAGQVAAGTKLPEELLAEQFGTSRARIRIALQHLAFENLVEQKRNRGAFVAAPTAREAQDVFAARQVIERATTEIVTRTITTRQVNMLKAIIVEREREWSMGRRELAIDGISMFHRSLAALAHNEALSIALERLILRTSLILGLYGTSRGLASAPPRYWALIGAIELGDSAAAAKVMDQCLFDMEKELDIRDQAGKPEERLLRPDILIS